MSAAPIAVSFLLMLVAGWALRPVAEAWFGTTPVVQVAQPVVMWLTAGLVGVIAWATYRTVQVHSLRLQPHQGLNRLVLGRTAALAGAMIAGGYFGYAVSWLGIDVELASQRIVRSVLAGLAGAAIVVGGLVLERACRVKDGEDAA